MDLQQYLAAVEKELRAGHATEHSFRPALKDLLQSWQAGVLAVNEPRRVACGAPDFAVTRNHIPLGHVEAKDVGRPLDQAEREEQLQRYRESLHNLVLTDYLEFRWFVGGEHRQTARLGTPEPNGRIRRQPGGAAAVAALLNGFFATEVATVTTPKDLAERMAALARLIRDTLLRALQDPDGGGELRGQMEAFRRVLLHDLTQEQFADMYAQTLCYGLFTARCNHNTGQRFTRQNAAYELPKTNPFLRKTFAHIAGPDLDERVVWAVDDLAELLNRADMDAILQNFGRRTRRQDPVVHFYETFLAAYDPTVRELRGVYYTPEPVVSYIVRSVDWLLKERFGIPKGLADDTLISVSGPDGQEQRVPRVQILDPATGTGTFLFGVIDQVYAAFQGNQGMWSGYVAQHLLPRLFGFELLMAPYAVAHMKLGLQLAETGYDFQADERVGIYLTNTLEEAAQAARSLFSQWLAEEANAAGRVKQHAPVMVVLGNPPYSKSSQNRGEWIERLMEEYKTTVRREETQIQALSDDYAKFIRFAQWRIQKTGYGVVAFITNNGYLDGPLFRDMRASLLRTFDTLYFLNLHGDSRRREIPPEGAADENVFDIQQGVSICFMVKADRAERPTEVYYADLWGSRHERYASLAYLHASTTVWRQISPAAPHWLFVPASSERSDEYGNFLSVVDIFGTGNRIADRHARYAAGFVTQQDRFAVAFDPASLLKNVEELLDPDADEGTLRAKFQLCTTNQWNYARARAELDVSRITALTRRVLYRPFDYRYTAFDRNVCTILRRRLMVHLDGPNLALLTTRRVTRPPWDNVLVANTYPEYKVVSHDRNTIVFPLYTYLSGDPERLFARQDPGPEASCRQANLAPKFVGEFEGRLGMRFVPDGKGDRHATFGPEDVFAYLYAILHAPTYRERYAEFLRIDFPRVPLTRDPKLFRALCALGEELVSYHLLEREPPAVPRFPVAGTNRVERVRYTEPGQGSEGGRVWINDAQYFAPVEPAVWGFHVGGYQVCEKWLKDRRGRTLTYDDLNHYARVVGALSETLRLMAEIDAAIEEHGGWPVG